MDPIESRISAAYGYAFLGLFDDAWEELDKLPAPFRTEDVIQKVRTEIYVNLCKWGEARVLSEELATRSPENPDWWIMWAFSLRREKSVEEAEVILRKAVELHPGEALINYNLGCYRSVSGDFHEAMEWLSKAFELEPDMWKQAETDSDLEPMFQNGILKKRI